MVDDPHHFPDVVGRVDLEETYVGIELCMTRSERERIGREVRLTVFIRSLGVITSATVVAVRLLLPTPALRKSRSVNIPTNAPVWTLYGAVTNTTQLRNGKKTQAQSE